eukprot:scaffold309_cov235-Pinguiococcus_pyrenoidosus.AAC.26
MVVTEQARKYPRTGKRGAPQAFPRKLFELLASEDRRVISWDAEGECFAIMDMEVFTRTTLERYYKHRKFTSFQRQLNLYGFRKIAKGKKCGYYVHPHFQRDRPEWLSKVRRTPQAGKGGPAAPGSSPRAAGKAEDPRLGSSPGPSTPRRQQQQQREQRQQEQGEQGEDDYDLCRSVTSLITQAVGLLEPAKGAQADDKQTRRLRRSGRRSSRRLREYEDKLLRMQERQNSAQDDDAAEEDSEAPDEKGEAGQMPAAHISEQPGLQDDDEILYPIMNPLAEVPSGSVYEALVFATGDDSELDEFDTMDMSEDSSGDEFFGGAITFSHDALLKTEPPMLSHDALPSLHRADFPHGDGSNDIDALWNEDMHIADDMMDIWDGLAS